MEQMCIGIYYFLGPVFVMAEWESSPHPLIPLLILLRTAAQEPLGPVHALGLGLLCSALLSPPRPRGAWPGSSSPQPRPAFPA